MASPFSAASRRFKQLKTAVKSTPKAAKKFGTTLASEGRKELSRPGSEASRFASAPGGQYYLPKSAQKALGFVLPSPKETYKAQAGFAKKPGLRTGARAGLNVVDIASAPLVATGARALGRGAARVAERGLAARGLSLAGETGAVKAGGRIQKIQKAIAAESLGAPKAGSKAAAAKVAAEADIAAESTSKLSRLSDDVIVQGLKSPVTKGSKALIREAQRRGISATNPVARAGGAPDIRVAAAKVMGISPERAAAGRNRETAMALAKAGKELGLSPQQLATEVRRSGVAKVARQINKAQRLKAAAPPEVAPTSTGISGVKSAATRAAEAATKPAKTAKASKVRTRKMTAEQIASFDNPKDAQGLDIVQPAVEKTGIKVAAKKVAAKAVAAEEKPRRTATEVAAKAVESQVSALRSDVQSALKGTSKRGVFKELATKHGVSKQRVNQIVTQERKRMQVAGVKGAVEEAGSAVQPAAKTGVTMAKPAAKAATVAAKAPKVVNTTPAVAEAAAPTIEKAVKVARPAKAAGETGAQAVKGQPKFLGSAWKRVPKKTAVLAGAAVLLANRDKFGVGGKKGSSPVKVSEERSWINNLPEDLRADVAALYEVKDKKGEAGLEALRQGLKAARQSPEFSSSAERSAPELSMDYNEDYKRLKRTMPTRAAKAEIRKRAKSRQKGLLRREVSEAYERLTK